MAVFTFPNHTLEVAYPESSAKVRFGKGWEFASAPKGPDQVVYTLNFAAMFFYQNSNGTYNKALNPTINMAVLEDFYILHKLYTKFTYVHPALGNITMRFSQPLSYKIKENGRGSTEPFSLQLTSQP